MTITETTPRAILEIPDVNGDGIRDFVIAHLDSGWGIGDDVTAYVYAGAKGIVSGEVGISVPVLDNKRTATVTEDYDYAVPYTDYEKGGGGVYKIPGRVLNLTVADQKGNDHAVQVFVPKDMYDAAAKPGATYIPVNVPEWGPMVVLGR